MQSTLWNYLNGYVIIAVKGFSWEKFINSAVSEGVSISELRFFPSHAEMKIPVKDYKKVMFCAKKHSCRIKILKRHGLPFTFHRLFKKGFFMWGALLFVISLFFLSSFIWEVNVEGNYRIPKNEILSFAKDCGIFPGSNKKNIDVDSASKSFIMKFEDISWISIKIKGSQANISISEAIEEKPSPLKENFSNIVAAKDGIIDKIYVSSGTALVSEGDTVFKGDILISGVLLNPVDGEVNTEELVPAEGKVFARNTYKISLALPKLHKEKVFFKEKSTYALTILGKDLSIPLDTEDSLFEKEISSEKTLSFGDYKLPFSLRKETYKFFTEETNTYTENEAEKILNNRLWYRLSKLDKETSVLEISSSFSENEKTFFLETEITLSENIGKEENI